MVGKSRTGSEWIKEQVKSGVKQITICAPTARALRSVNIEGESGLLSVYSPNDPDRPIYEPSKAQVSWPKSGARAVLISAENPNSARGLNSEVILLDEIGSMPDRDIVDQLLMGLRLGKSKCLITTTPYRNEIILDLYKRVGKDVRLISGSTWENKDNLSGMFINTITQAYEGTSLAKQELEGQLVLTNPGALWSPELIAEATTKDGDLLPRMDAYCVAVDPAVSTKKKSDLTGMVLVGLGEDNILYILGDYSDKMSPQTMAKKVVEIYNSKSTEAPVTIVVENNNGGRYIEDVIYRERSFLPIKSVFHSTNKLARAQPIALLYEQGKVKHVRGAKLDRLEEEMSTYDGSSKQKSPDVMDAMVMACTYLSPMKKNRIITKEFLL